MLARRTNPPLTGRIYDRNRPEGLRATNHSRDNREESIYGLLGRWLLGVTAAGFVAYDFYEIIHTRYLHIRWVR